MRTLGAAAAALAAAALPALGFLTLRWWHRRAEVWEDVVTFFQVVGRPRLRERLVGERAALAAELDELEAAWAHDRPPAEPTQRSSP